MKNLIALLFVSLFVFFVTSCTQDEKDVTVKKDFLVANLDTTISPSKDFFDYANGDWIKRNLYPMIKAVRNWRPGTEENLKTKRD
jgi:putative endopeptidase